MNTVSRGNGEKEVGGSAELTIVRGMSALSTFK